MRENKLYVVLPCYNEEQVLLETAEVSYETKERPRYLIQDFLRDEQRNEGDVFYGR